LSHGLGTGGWAGFGVCVSHLILTSRGSSCRWTVDGRYCRPGFIRGIGRCEWLENIEVKLGTLDTASWSWRCVLFVYKPRCGLGDRLKCRHPFDYAMLSVLHVRVRSVDSRVTALISLPRGIVAMPRDDEKGGRPAAAVISLKAVKHGRILPRPYIWDDHLAFAEMLF